MADETTEQPVIADNTPDENSLNGTGAAEPKPTEDEARKKLDFKDRIIAQKASELRESKRMLNTVTERLQGLEQIVKTIQPPAGHVASEPQPKTLTPQEIEALAVQKANAMLAEREFNKACDEVAEKGSKAFPDFQRVYADTFLASGDPPPVEFLQTIVKLKNPHQILYTLAKDPDEAHRIMSLPSIERTAELTRLENKPVKPQVSGATPPIRPVEGKRPSGAVDLLDPNTSSDEWFRKRAEEKAARFTARRSR